MLKKLFYVFAFLFGLFPLSHAENKSIEDLFEKMVKNVKACGINEDTQVKNLSLPCQKVLRETTLFRNFDNMYKNIFKSVRKNIPEEKHYSWTSLGLFLEDILDIYSQLYLASEDAAEDRIELLEEGISFFKDHLQLFTSVEGKKISDYQVFSDFFSVCQSDLDELKRLQSL